MSSEAAYFPDAPPRADDRSSALECPAIGNVTPPAVDLAPLVTAEAISLEDLSDEVLLEKVANDGREALAILFRRHARLVHNVACRILRDETEAEDLVQDVFIFLFRKANLYKATRGEAISWILQVTYHRAFDRRSYLNARRYYTSVPVEAAMQLVSRERAEQAFTQWTLEGIWGTDSAARLRVLLSPHQLATIQLHFFEGYTLAEIAELLGQNIGNVKHHYHRALEKLRRPAFSSKLRPR